MAEGKVCNKCKVFFEYSNFYRSKSKKDGYQIYCKKCANDKVNEYYRNNKDKKSKFNLRYRKNNKEKIAEYKAGYARNNRDRTNERNRNRRAKKAQAKGTFIMAEFTNKVKDYDQRCYYCAQKLKLKAGRLDVHVEHYIPLFKGGNNDMTNIVPACPKCNLSKGVKMPWEFKKGESMSPKLPELWRLDEGLDK